MTDGPRRVKFVHTLQQARDYQDRQEFTELCRWWKDGGAGVCALIGIGGAGKTALVEQFLWSLPRVMRSDSRQQIRGSGLREPEGVFVFSFYLNPHVDVFWKALYSWCVGDFQLRDERARDESGGALPPTAQQLDDALRLLPSPILVVLDGLERIQDGVGQGRIFGRLQDPMMRDFILRVADGLLPVSVLITSRFTLFDPWSARSRYNLEIKVDTLTPRAAIALLRARGVSRGSDYDLEWLAKEQGFHALTVDLLGGYIGFFCQGDPSRLPPVPRDLLPESTTDGDPALFALQEQEKRFARVAAWYQETLEKEDPACLALLRRICLFRLGVSTRRLEALFLGPGKEAVSGTELSLLSPRNLEERLNWLVSMRLVESVERPEGRVHTVHPAVRDGFLEGLGSSETRAGHRRVWQSLEKVLIGRPGERYPSDAATLELLEEIVFHAIEADEFEDAWDIYFNRLGAFKNLGIRLGEFQRGERICRAFTFNRPPEAAPLPKSFSQTTQAHFLNDWACYLLRLGRLEAAVRCYRRMMDIPVRLVRLSDASIVHKSLAEVHLLAGHLTTSLQDIAESLTFANRAEDETERAEGYGFRGYV